MPSSWERMKIITRVVRHYREHGRTFRPTRQRRPDGGPAHFRTSPGRCAHSRHPAGDVIHRSRSLLAGCVRPPSKADRWFVRGRRSPAETMKQGTWAAGRLLRSRYRNPPRASREILEFRKQDQLLGIICRGVQGADQRRGGGRSLAAVSRHGPGPGTGPGVWSRSRSRYADAVAPGLSPGVHQGRSTGATLFRPLRLRGFVIQRSSGEASV
jgi:hypothetical protein